MKKYNNYLVVLVLLILSACSSDNDIEPVFEENTQTRVLDNLKELNALLLSSEFGWVVDYVPNDDSGVYKMHIKFNDDNTAEITSDHDQGNSDGTTSYRVGIAQIPELVFETYSVFANITDNFDGRQGVNFSRDAEFQFSFTDIVSESEIILESKSDIEIIQDDGVVLSSKSILNLKRANSGDKDKIATITGRDLILVDSYVPNSSLIALPFRGMIITDASDNLKLGAKYSFNPFFRNANFNYENESEEEVNENIGVELTTNGFVLSKAFDFEGESFKNFTYKEDTNTFISESGNLTATITGSELPLFVNKDVFEVGETEFLTMLYRPSLGDNDFISFNFNQIVTNTRSNFAPLNLDFFEFRVRFIATQNRGTQTEFDTIMDFTFDSTVDDSSETFSYAFSSSVSDDRKLIFNFVGAFDDRSLEIQPQLQELLNFFILEGLFYENQGPFTSTTNSFSNISGSLLSSSDPSLSVYIVWL